LKYWDRQEKLFKYTEGVRQFFPLADDQLKIIARMIDKFIPAIETFLDLGCGDGFLGHFIHKLFPDASGVFIDISEEMINKARARDMVHNPVFIIEDFGNPDWYKSISDFRNFDLVISGYSIHHVNNQKKKRLYGDIYKLLNPGGLFLNIEHVSSASKPLEELYNELFLDCMSDYHESRNENKTIEEIKSIYHDPEHKKLNLLESVDNQCNWLREIGFYNVDCYFKIFELALFGGTRN
jgi:SAM-dependent methyltransferase